MIHELQIDSSTFKEAIKNKSIKVREKKTFLKGDFLILKTDTCQRYLGIEVNKEVEYVVNLEHGYTELGIK
ncbi:TPA: RNA-binding protein [Clostridioides difficile]